MKLSELISQSRLIEVRCEKCRAKTPLDPAFFLARRGDIDLGKLSRRLHCAQCGAAEIELASIKQTPLGKSPNASAPLGA
jgi:hypothetical protein